MGRADEYQFDYLDDNRRFADQINGALFHGRQVVKPDELETYSNLDSDTRELLEVIAKVKIKEEKQEVEKEEKKYDLCKAFVDMKLEGIEEGKAEGS